MLDDSKLDCSQLVMGSTSVDWFMSSLTALARHELVWPSAKTRSAKWRFLTELWQPPQGVQYCRKTLSPYITNVAH